MQGKVRPRLTPAAACELGAGCAGELCSAARPQRPLMLLRQVGNDLSHVRLWHKLLGAALPYALVLEDDASPVTGAGMGAAATRCLWTTRVAAWHLHAPAVEGLAQAATRWSARAPCQM